MCLPLYIQQKLYYVEHKKISPGWRAKLLIMNSLSRTMRTANPLIVSDFALAFNNAADRIILFAGAVEDAFGFLELFGRNDQQHANSHVEGAHHFALLNVPQHLHVSKDG